jgi:hypothetical protein
LIAVKNEGLESETVLTVFCFQISPHPRDARLLDESHEIVAESTQAKETVETVP